MPLDGSHQRRTGSALQLPPEGDDLLGRAAQVDDGLVVGPHVCFEARRVADVRVRAHEIGPSCGRAAAPIPRVLESSEERRVGKEGIRSYIYLWSPYNAQNKKKR